MSVFSKTDAFETLVQRYIMVRYYKGPEAACEHLVDAGIDPTLVYLVHKAGSVLVRNSNTDI